MIERVLETFYFEVDGFRKMNTAWRRARKISTLTMVLWDGDVRDVAKVMLYENILMLMGVSMVYEWVVPNRLKLFFYRKTSRVTDKSYLAISVSC